MGRATWSAKALSEILLPNREAVRVSKDGEYPNLGLYSFGRGAFIKPPIEGSKTSATTLYRVRAGQFIYSRLFAFEGAFAVVPSAMDGWYVSNEYPTFEVDATAASPEFVQLALSRPSTWRDIASRTIGMGHRRQRLQPDALLAYEIRLPSLAEQSDIVHAVSAADEAIIAASTEASAAADLLAALRVALLADREVVRLRDVLVKIQAGKSPKCPDRPLKAGERGVLKVSAIRAGEFRPTEAKPAPVDFSFPEHARVRAGDVLIGRANTRALVGAACLVETTDESLYLCDKTLRLVPDAERVDSIYLVHALASRVARAHLENAARGTSDSMKNVSQADIFATPIPRMDLVEQRRAAAKLEAARVALREALKVHDASQALRVSLLEALFDGSRRIVGSRELVPA